MNGLIFWQGAEVGASPVGAAVASAVDDALGMSGAVTRLPVPPQRLETLLAAR